MQDNSVKHNNMLSYLSSLDNIMAIEPFKIPFTINTTTTIINNNLIVYICKYICIYKINIYKNKNYIFCMHIKIIT